MSFIELINFNPLNDDRGQLIALESMKNIPFEIKRVYYLYDLNNTPRGFHAHKELKQVAICLRGSCRFTMDNGYERLDVILNSPHQGILIPRMIWREMHDFDDCILMIVASELYNEGDYIRNYDQFLKEVGNK